MQLKSHSASLCRRVCNYWTKAHKVQNETKHLGKYAAVMVNDEKLVCPAKSLIEWEMLSRIIRTIQPDLNGKNMARWMIDIGCEWTNS